MHAAKHIFKHDMNPLQDVVNEAVERTLELGFREEDLLRSLQGRLRMRRPALGSKVSGRKIADRSYL